MDLLKSDFVCQVGAWLAVNRDQNVSGKGSGACQLETVSAVTAAPIRGRAGVMGSGEIVTLADRAKSRNLPPIKRRAPVMEFGLIWRV